MKTYGYLGMGIMGSAMARRLLDAGHSLVVWNRTRERCDPLVAAGAEAAASPAEVARRCPVTFACLADPDAAREVALGPDGVAEGIGEGRGYVDLSTVDPRTVLDVEEGIVAAGGRFLEVPVSGSKKPAEEGTLVMLAAGDESLFAEVRAQLDLLGKKTVFLGATGNGARMKLVVNQVMGVTMAALSEGLALAGSTGLDPEELLDVLDAGAVSNPMFRIKGPAMIRGEFPTHFPLRHMQKDLRLALGLGEEQALPLPVTAAANGSFLRARSAGHGGLDFSAVHRAVRGGREAGGPD